MTDNLKELQKQLKSQGLELPDQSKDMATHVDPAYEEKHLGLVGRLVEDLTEKYHLATFQAQNFHMSDGTIRSVVSYIGTAPKDEVKKLVDKASTSKNQITLGDN